jgi:hypothetical protein
MICRAIAIHTACLEGKSRRVANLLNLLWQARVGFQRPGNRDAAIRRHTESCDTFPVIPLPGGTTPTYGAPATVAATSVC